jgi:putative tricarboxylic transport membrane protein
VAQYAAGEVEGEMKITNGKDFWAGVMFIAFGLGFMVVAQNYAMGNAVRMGPAYFPTVLGGMLAVLGAVVFLRAFLSKIEHPLRVFPFRLWHVLIGLGLGVVAYYTQPSRDANLLWQIGHMLLAGLAVGLIFAAFGERSLWVILFSVVIFGYALKPLGLVIATGLLVYVSAWGGHEFKVKEVTILFVALAIFSVFAFVRGLGLPMNIWPGILE